MKSSSQETEQNPRPHQGAIEFFHDSLRPKIRTAGRQQVLTTGADVHTESGVGLVSRCVLEEGMHMHMVLACSQPNPTKPQEPGSAMRAELSVGNVTNKAAKRRQPW